MSTGTTATCGASTSEPATQPLGSIAEALSIPVATSVTLAPLRPGSMLHAGATVHLVKAELVGKINGITAGLSIGGPPNDQVERALGYAVGSAAGSASSPALDYAAGSASSPALDYAAGSASSPTVSYAVRCAPGQASSPTVSYAVSYAPGQASSPTMSYAPGQASSLTMSYAAGQASSPSMFFSSTQATGWSPSQATSPAMFFASTQPTGWSPNQATSPAMFLTPSQAAGWSPSQAAGWSPSQAAGWSPSQAGGRSTITHSGDPMICESSVPGIRGFGASAYTQLEPEGGTGRVLAVVHPPLPRRASPLVNYVTATLNSLRSILNYARSWRDSIDDLHLFVFSPSARDAALRKNEETRMKLLRLLKVSRSDDDIEKKCQGRKIYMLQRRMIQWARNAMANVLRFKDMRISSVTAVYDVLLRLENVIGGHAPMEEVLELHRYISGLEAFRPSDSEGRAIVMELERLAKDVDASGPAAVLATSEASGQAAVLATSEATSEAAVLATSEASGQALSQTAVLATSQASSQAAVLATSEASSQAAVLATSEASSEASSKPVCQASGSAAGSASREASSQAAVLATSEASGQAAVLATSEASSDASSQSAVLASSDASSQAAALASIKQPLPIPRTQKQLRAELSELIGERARIYKITLSAQESCTGDASLEPTIREINQKAIERGHARLREISQEIERVEVELKARVRLDKLEETRNTTKKALEEAERAAAKKAAKNLPPGAKRRDQSKFVWGQSKMAFAHARENCIGLAKDIQMIRHAANYDFVSLGLNRKGFTEKLVRRLSARAHRVMSLPVNVDMSHSASVGGSEAGVAFWGSTTKFLAQYRSVHQEQYDLPSMSRNALIGLTDRAITEATWLCSVMMYECLMYRHFPLNLAQFKHWFNALLRVAENKMQCALEIKTSMDARIVRFKGIDGPVAAEQIGYYDQAVRIFKDLQAILVEPGTTTPTLAPHMQEVQPPMTREDFFAAYPYLVDDMLCGGRSPISGQASGQATSEVGGSAAGAVVVQATSEVAGSAAGAVVVQATSEVAGSASVEVRIQAASDFEVEAMGPAVEQAICEDQRVVESVAERVALRACKRAPAADPPRSQPKRVKPAVQGAPAEAQKKRHRTRGLGKLLTRPKYAAAKRAAAKAATAEGRAAAKTATTATASWDEVEAADALTSMMHRFK